MTKRWLMPIDPAIQRANEDFLASVERHRRTAMEGRPRLRDTEEAALIELDVPDLIAAVRAYARHFCPDRPVRRQP